jgi:hypothetical protein
MLQQVNLLLNEINYKNFSFFALSDFFCKIVYKNKIYFERWEIKLGLRGPPHSLN